MRLNARVNGCLLAVALLIAPLSSPGVTVTDDTGREVSLEAPAQRIVSLAPHLTEILFELGVGDRITGTVRYADYPPAAREIPRLGDAFSVSVEAVLAAQPDVVFAWRTGGASRSVERLQQMGLLVYMNEAPTLSAIPRSVVAMADLVGRADEGRRLAADFESGLEALKQPAGSARVFFQISDERLYTVNNTHLIGEAITLCGARNVFAGSRIAVPLVSREAVLAARPDLIVITHEPGSAPSPWFARWRDVRGLEARVEGIDPNLISRPGLRMQTGIGALCALVNDIP